MNDIIDLIRLADPADSNSVIDKSDPRAQAILQQVVSHHNDRSPATAKRRRVSRRKFVVASVAAVAGVLGLLQSPFGGMPTANAAVRSAVSRSIGAPSGRAVVHINVTGSTNKPSDAQPGDPASIAKRVTGVINVAWAGTDESYDHEFSDTTKWSVRVVDGVTYLRLGNKPWTQATPEQAYETGLSGAEDQFEVLKSKLTFRDDGSEIIDGVNYRHIIAIGDLSPLDTTTRRSGFLLGTNGAPGATTQSFELWLNDTDGIRRVNTTFTATEREEQRTFGMTTDISDIGAHITITKP
jgi:hypothetical protein